MKQPTREDYVRAINDDGFRSVMTELAEENEQLRARVAELSTDVSVIRVFIEEAIHKINEGGQSRERSLAKTNLQEALRWLGKDLSSS